jgi:death-on-curing protein
VIAWLSVEDVIVIHDQLESAPVIDPGKLAAAIARPQATFEGALLHSSVYMQASVLLHGLCQAHAFLDGNKRTAWVSAVTFLSINGIELSLIGPVEMSDYMVEVATGIHSAEDTAFLFADLASG